jgi:undecaprenyl-diphosphatase
MWLVLQLLDREDPTLLVNEIAERAGLSDVHTSGEIGFAQFAAAFVVLGPFVSKRWRRAGAISLTVLVLLRFLVGYYLPGNVIVSIPLGAAVGAAVLLVFGRPDRRPTIAAIAQALASAGLAVRDLRAAKVDARGSTPYFAVLEDGQGLFVKVLGESERAADLMYRVYRFLRLKDVGDDRPFSSLQRAVEHEALISLAARDIGVHTPRMRGVVRVGVDSMLLAYDRIDGSSIDALPDEAGDRRRDGLRCSNRWPCCAGTASPIATCAAPTCSSTARGRRGSSTSASPSSPWTTRCSTPRSPRCSPPSLSSPARRARSPWRSRCSDATSSPARCPASSCRRSAGRRAPRCASARACSPTCNTRCKAQTGVTEVHFADLERVDKKTILMVAVLAGATYFLLPQLADLPGIFSQISEANWGWAPLVVLMSLITYIGAAAGLAGAVSTHVRAGPLVVSQVASEFASKLAPASVGGMALNVRFLQKSGVDRPVSVSAVGLDTVAGFIGHISLIGVFIIWAGRRRSGASTCPTSGGSSSASPPSSCWRASAWRCR